MWKNTVETDRPHTVWGMCLVCWIAKAANTHSVSNTVIPQLTSDHANEFFS